MSLPSLQQRSNEPEIMDDLSCSGDVVAQTLHELDVINRWLGGHHVTLSGVRTMLKARVGTDAIAIADLGCGSGDLLRKLAEYGRSRNLTLHLTGVDANPNIVDYARRQSTQYPEIEFLAQDVLASEFCHRRYDIIIGTLFFHHFEDTVLTKLLAQLVGQSRIGVLINDIHRHPLAYHSIRLLTGLFSSSSMVRYDAPLSVRRAFRRQDWDRLLPESGIVEFRIQWKWAFRWQILLPAPGSRLAQFW